MRSPARGSRQTRGGFRGGRGRPSFGERGGGNFGDRSFNKGGGRSFGGRGGGNSGDRSFNKSGGDGFASRGGFRGRGNNRGGNRGGRYFDANSSFANGSDSQNTKRLKFSQSAPTTPATFDRSKKKQNKPFEVQKTEQTGKKNIKRQSGPMMQDFPKEKKKKMVAKQDVEMDTDEDEDVDFGDEDSIEMKKPKGKGKKIANVFGKGKKVVTNEEETDEDDMESEDEEDLEEESEEEDDDEGVNLKNEKMKKPKGKGKKIENVSGKGKKVVTNEEETDEDEEDMEEESEEEDEDEGVNSKNKTLSKITPNVTVLSKSALKTPGTAKSNKKVNIEVMTTPIKSVPMQITQLTPHPKKGVSRLTVENAKEFLKMGGKIQEEEAIGSSDDDDDEDFDEEDVESEENDESEGDEDESEGDEDESEEKEDESEAVKAKAVKTGGDKMEIGKSKKPTSGKQIKEKISKQNKGGIKEIAINLKEKGVKRKHDNASSAVPEKQPKVAEELLSEEKRRREERDKKSLFIRGLPKNVKTSDLQELHEDIVSIRHLKNRRYGWLIFASENHCEKAFLDIEKKTVNGSAIIVDFCGPKSKTRSEKKKNDFQINPLELYVSGFPPGTTKEQLLLVFRSASGVSFPKSARAKKKLYCFVHFANENDTKAAFDKSKNLKIGGCPVDVLYGRIKPANEKSKAVAASQNSQSSGKNTKDSEKKEEKQVGKNEQAKSGKKAQSELKSGKKKNILKTAQKSADVVEDEDDESMVSSNEGIIEAKKAAGDLANEESDSGGDESDDEAGSEMDDDDSEGEDEMEEDEEEEDSN